MQLYERNTDTGNMSLENNLFNVHMLKVQAICFWNFLMTLNFEEEGLDCLRHTVIVTVP